MSRPQDLVEHDRTQRAKPKVVDLERSDLQVGAAGCQDQRDGSHSEVGALREVDPAVDPDLGADHRDEAEQVELDPAQDAERDAQDQGAELGDETEQDRRDRGHYEDPDAEDPGDAHDADVLGVRGFACAPEERADRGAQAVAHKRAAQVTGEVALHDPSDRVDVAGVLGDQDDGDEPEEAHRAAEVAEVREAELRQRHPACFHDAAEVDVAGGLGVVADGVDEGDDVADHDADQDGQQPGKAAQIDAGESRGQERDRRGEELFLGAADRHRAERQADHGDDRARDDRRHQETDQVDARHEVDERPDDEVDDPGHQDAGKGQAMVRMGCPLHDEDGPDERERGPQVARHLAVGDEQEDQRRDAAEEDHRVRIEAQDQRHQHGRPEHCHHVLDAHQDRLRPGQPLLGIDEVALARGDSSHAHPLDESGRRAPLS